MITDTKNKVGISCSRRLVRKGSIPAHASPREEQVAGLVNVTSAVAWSTPALRAALDRAGAMTPFGRML
jgi:hypothetical protein